MLAENVLLGGEESGGYGWVGGIPERDGILNAILITEMLSKTNRKLSQFVDDLTKRFGKSYYLRRDIKLRQPVDKKKFTKEIKSLFMRSNQRIKEIKDYDGIKIIFEDDRWLLIRPSGTEPVIRTYSETDSVMKTKKLLNLAGKVCCNFVNPTSTDGAKTSPNAHV